MCVIWHNDKKCPLGVREIHSIIESNALLAEDLSSITSTHVGQLTSTCNNSKSLRICHPLVTSAGTHRHMCTYTQTNTDLYMQIHFRISKMKYSAELEILRDSSSLKRVSWLRFDSSRAPSCQPSQPGSRCRVALDAGYLNEQSQEQVPAVSKVSPNGLLLCTDVGEAVVETRFCCVWLEQTL